jgi:hypothetical protein
VWGDHEGQSSARSARCSVRLLMTMLAMVLAAPVAVRADVLPDGRVYEQVSPVVKNGFDAGAPGKNPKYAWAMADGSGLLYGVRGPMGTVHRGIQDYAVARRGADGWSSESALPSGSSDRIFLSTFAPSSVVPSSDLTKIVFTAGGSYVPDNPQTVRGSSGLYEGHADGTVEWLSRPHTADPFPAPGSIPNISVFQPVGGSPDLSTVYFWSGPTLLAQDAAREISGLGGWGLYEYANGVLMAAGTLPDGTESPGGAAPASSEGQRRGDRNFTSPERTSNQVSRDGSSLLFVSPDPGPNPLVGPVTQLYLRRGGHSTLVSHLPDKSPAPSGAAPVLGMGTALQDAYPHVFAYGAADGKTVIFQSADALASGAANSGALNTYSYDVDTDTVSYLPGVDGTVVAASDDVQRFLFTDASRIAVWDRGSVKSIASVGAYGYQLAPARATASGSVFLFSTQAPIPGFNSGGVIQVYRYEVEQDKLTCLSCPPDGVVPSGDARLSNQDSAVIQPSGELVPSRGLSDDGGRVFFETPDPLVSRDTNGKRDVYEWTPSGVALISSGRSQEDSLFLDSSASGNDVFFATSEGLDPGDTDASYDVYDARVGGGFKRIDQAAPCIGEACRPDATAAPSLPEPGSASLSGKGNQEPSRTETQPAARLKLGGRRLVAKVLEVSVTVSRPGRVSISGDGLHGLSKSFAKAGSFKIRVALSAMAKRSLQSHHRLRLSVRVGFVPQSGPASSVKFVLNAKA